MQKKILVIDVGGTNVKVCSTDQPTLIKIPSGSTMNAQKMVKAVREAVKGWKYDVVTIGYPGVVRHNQIMTEPHNLAKGWIGFDFKKAFGRPVKIINDAAMQALGSYKEKRMLFLGLGTGLGSAMVLDGVLQPMELAHLPYKKGRTYEEYVGAAGLERVGKKKWRLHVADVVDRLQKALLADTVVLGGGNARLLKVLPADTRLGGNDNAILGGYRVWEKMS